MDQAARQPFDLEQGPLLRVRLFSRSVHDQILIVSVHQLVADAWSLVVLVAELGALYAGQTLGETVALEPPTVDYADFIRRQQAMLAGPDGEQLWAYWQQQLRGDLPALNLPTDHPRPPIPTYRGTLHSFTIGHEVTRALANLSEAYDATLDITVLAAFQVLLCRYTGQTDLVLGVATTGRDRAGLAEAVGVFADRVVLRATLAGTSVCSTFLAQTRETVRAALRHQDYPFALLAERLHGASDSSAPPLVQVLFTFQQTPQADFAGMPLESIALDEWPIQHDLSLLVTQGQDELVVCLHYNRDLFEPPTIHRMADHFQRLLASIVAHPDGRIAEFALLSAAERQQILIDWNATSQPYADQRCIHELFEAQVSARPNATAVCFGDACLTYAELNRRANQLAHALQRQGVGPEVLVGICMERSLELIVGMLGVFKAGGAYVPLDPHYPRERLAYMLEDAQAPVLLTQQHLVQILPADGARIVCLDSDWPLIAQERSENLVSAVFAHNLAYVIYTSGSTGRPKGVLVHHQGLCNLAQSEIQVNNARPDSRVLQFSSISFDASIDEIWTALVSGATLYLAPPQVLLGSALANLLRDQAITIALLPPSATASMPPTDLPLLQTINVGGEACTADIVTRWAPGRRFVNAYGLTETTVCATVAYCEDDGRRPSIGRPTANMQIYLLDAQLQPVPIGVPAEMYIGGAGLARGYRNRPDLTAERFIPNPFSDSTQGAGGERLYKTGDLARYLPDGSIDYLGRIDHQVKIRGYRIELGEIEGVLTRHPEVRETVVLAREDPPGNTRLVAYIVPQPGALPAPKDLRGFLKAELPEYMVPAAFVLLESFPLTPNDKIDRKALPAPDPAQFMESRDVVAPRTPTEELLASIWASTLGLPQIGIHDHFFELGGHSLLATQVLSRIRETLRVELSLHSFFAAPTVADLAALVESAGRMSQGALTTIPRAERPDDLPLSFAQRRLWFLDQLEPNSPAYNIAMAMHLAGALDVAALRESLNIIVQRHEALRTSFAARDGDPVQVIAPTMSLPLPVCDLQALPVAQREAEIQRLVNAAAQQPFDLAQGPLIRAGVVRLGPEAHVLMLTLHHIVADGWSLGVLFAELATVYPALVDRATEDLADRLPELPIQYADYALWQQTWLRDAALDNQLAYWRQQLDGAPTVLHLPTDRPRPPVQTFHGARHTLKLSRRVIDSLTAFNQREGVTLFMTLFAAFQALLYRYTGQDDLVVGAPIANRTRTETEPLIGFFVNTLALRTDLSGNPTFHELLGRVREVALSAYAHQDLPFEHLVQALQPERNVSHTPLIQVLFVLQNTPLAALDLPGLTITPIEDDGSSVKFDLTLEVTDALDGLDAIFKYNTDLFDAATIVRMAGHFQTLLEAALSDSRLCLGDLPMLTAAECQQMLGDWNATHVAFPDPVGVHALIEAQAFQRPDELAVVFEDTRLTYTDLNRRANQLAHYLRAHGVGPDVPVGICMARSAEIVVALLGVLKAGGAYVPLDPKHPSDRLAAICEDAGISVVVTQQALAAALPVDRSQAVCLDIDCQALSQEPDTNPAPITTADHLAYSIFTSGSTGRPKGVALPHRQLLNYVYSIERRLNLPPGAVFATVSTFAADLGNTAIFPALCGGGCLHVIADERLSEPDALAEYMHRHAIDCLKIVPSHLAALLTAAEPAHVLPRRLLVLGGEAANWELIGQIQALAPACRILNHYGPTETTVGVLTYPVQACAADQMPGIVPLGRPLDNMQMLLLDRHLQPVPIGVPGELYIGGVQLARGYLHRPDLTAERFIPHPFSTIPGMRLYKSGDVARFRPDGAIEFLGRVDHQVKIRGFRIELGEIEAVLTRHPDVREAVVVARSDTPNNPYLSAYVVAQPGVTLAGQDVQRYLREELPDYMVPAAVVLLAALPLTSNGKIDRRALPAPEAQGIERSGIFVAPRDTIELRLARIWEDLLKVSPVSVTDNFFELGGHSLLAVRLMSQIRDRLGQQLALTVLFQGATIQDLALRLRQGTNDLPQSHLVALQPQGSLRPFFCVHPAGGNVMCYIDLAKHLGSDRPFYAFQASGLEGDQEPYRCLEDLAAHYVAALRERQPQGPYLLGGWSMGGVVAFEMAQQLRQQGVYDIDLMLIDSFASACGPSAAVDTTERMPIDFGEALGLERSDLDVDYLSQLAPDAQLAYVLEQAQLAYLLAPDVDLSQFRRLFRVYQANVQCMRAYIPRRYAGSLTLLKADEQLFDAADSPTLGWDRLADEGVVTYVVPGNHFSLIKRPQVASLAERLRVCFDAAEESGGLREREAQA
jgi:amino acid adenylation domain-containing protein